MSVWIDSFNAAYSIPHTAVYAPDNSGKPMYENTYIYENPNCEQVSGPVYELEEFPTPCLPPVSEEEP